MAVKRGPGIPPFAGGHAPKGEPPIKRHMPEKKSAGGFGQVGFGHHDEPEVGPYAGMHGKRPSEEPPMQGEKRRFPEARDPR